MLKTCKNWLKIPILTITVISLLSPNLFAEEADKPETPSKWKSSVATSYVTASGNSESQTLSISADANRWAATNEQVFKAGIIYGKSEGEKTSEYWYTSAKHEHSLAEKSYVFILSGLEGNKLAGYSLRFNLSPGLGYRLLEGRHTLKAEAGPGYVYENRIGDDNQSFLSGRAYASYKFQITENTSIAQDAEYLYDFSNPDNYRFNTNTSLVVKLSDLISFKTGVDVKYVNEPPEGNEHSDVFTSTSLVFTF